MEQPHLVHLANSGKQDIRSRAQPIGIRVSSSSGSAELAGLGGRGSTIKSCSFHSGTRLPLAGSSIGAVSVRHGSSEGALCLWTLMFSVEMA
jgi:hypothetical protein